MRDETSHRVPVLYAGANLSCALGETVFHDLPDDAHQPAEVFRADLLSLRAATVTVTTDIDLVDLSDGALSDYGFARVEVVDTPASDYPVTRRWAQHAWDTTECAGLAWNSRRSPDLLSYMLFVGAPRRADRHRALDRLRHLDVIIPPLPLHDGNGLAAVMNAAAARNVTVVV